MICPKCRARIGMQQQSVITVFGNAAAVSCYLCGYWLQVFPKLNQEETSHKAKAGRLPDSENICLFMH